MTYQWGPGGPAFEFEGVFRTENRVLVARAVLLTLLAAAALMLAMSDLRFPSWMSPRLSRLPQGERTPHLLMGLFLLVLAVMDVVRASRQRVSRLLPGQPASLLPPATPSEGISPGAAALVGMLAEGLAVQALPRGEPAGGWQRLLVRLAPSIGAAPWALQDWMERRMAMLALIGGLLPTLALSELLQSQPAGRAVVAGVCITIVVAALLREAWVAAPAPRPRTVGALLALTLVLGLPLGWASGWLPDGATGLLASGGLSLGAACLLGALLVVEALALRAGAVTTDPPLAGGLHPALAQVQIAADPDSVRQEIEREIHLYWVEGIPNRRYARQAGSTESKAGGAPLVASTLEESQPVVRPAAAGGGVTSIGTQRRPWLLALLALSLLLTAMAGLLWGWLVVEQLRRVMPPLGMGAAAVLVVLAGGHALRVAHLLWSRVEMESRLLWLEADAVPASGGGAEPAAAARAAVKPPTPGTPVVRLRWSVAHARSVCYLAGEHRLGDRCLLELTADEATARRSALSVQQFAEKLFAAGGSTPSPPRPAAPPRPPRAPEPASLPPADRRFCVACGQAIAARARFCPTCGAYQQDR